MRWPALILSVTLAVSCGEPSPLSTDDDQPADDLMSRLQAGEAVTALVKLDDGDDTAHALTGQGAVWTPDELASRAGRLTALRTAVRKDVPTAVEARPLRHVPVLVLRLTSPDELEALQHSAYVKGIFEDVAYEATLTESLNLIGQPGVAANGDIGTGTTVAVLDTGLDYRNVAFGSCTAPGTPSTCKVPYVQDFAPNDGALDANGHGTNVAGIVVGVAPGARVLGLDVFTGASAYTSDVIAAIDWVVQNRATYNIVAINMSLGGGSASAPCGSDPFSAAITTAKNAGILSAVASGNNGYTNLLASPACAPDAVSVGAVYDSNLGPMGFSVCSDSTTAADKVTCFSNSASFLTLLAPGSSITAAGITMSGTSQASPHVAGAIAVVAGRFPNESAALRLSRLVSSGVAVRDARNGITTPRIDLSGALTGCSYAVSPTSGSLTRTGGTLSFDVQTASDCSWTAQSNAAWMTVQSGASGTGPGTVVVAVQPNTATSRSGSVSMAGKTLPVTQTGDQTAPQGSVTIANGDAWTRTTAVALSLSATDDVAVTSMCLSTGTSCSAWVPYATSANVTLPGGNGVKTVRAWFRDAGGNVSAVATDSITLDVTAPTGGAVTAVAGNAQVTLSWSGFSDAASGLAGYTIVMAPTTAPSNCTSTGTVVTALTTGTSYVVTGLANGTPYGFRVCAKDVAGNTSTGAVAKSSPAPEFNGPTNGSVSINAGATWTKSVSVTLTLSASDATSVAQMCISNTTACMAWKPFASTTTWSLAGGAGTRTVSVWFKDPWGNVSASPAKGSISLDSTAPANGALGATPGNAQATLSWSGFSDATSGIAGYTIVMAPTTAPNNCANGTVVTALATGTSYVVTGLTNGATYGFRVCAKDVAGNTSTGVAVKAVPAPEFNGPTNGSVTINAGATWTKAVSVTLTLSASDATSVAKMCISNTTACMAWKPFASTTTWSLAGGAGTRTVSVWFKDPWGNVSASPATDSILLDAAAPTNGTVSATPGNAQATLSWSGFADATSGIAGYTIVMAPTTAPTNCASGTVVTALTTGTSYVVTGLTNGATYGFRVCAKDVAGNTSTGVTLKTVPAPEFNGPTNGSVSINAGATWTKSVSVTLMLSASDATSVAQMCISNTATCTAWKTFASTATWSLSGGAGTRTVSVWFKDPWGNVSTSPATDSILLDSAAPANGTLTVTPGDAQATLSWSGFADATSGIAGYTIVMAPTTAPTNCASGTVVTALTTGTSYVVTGLTNGTTYGFRVCAKDVAGNTSTGVMVKTVPAPEFNGPTNGSVSINAGATWTKSVAVTLTLSATDATSIAQMCITNTTTCTAWKTFAPTTTWSLSGGAGTRTVSVWFKDPWGNVSASPATDSILLDSALPSNGAATATPGDAQVTLSWSGFADATSGIAGYTIVMAPTTAPTNCASGTVVTALTTGTSYVVTGLTNGTTYGFRVCAKDVAGNTSTGVMVKTVPAPEFNGPTNGSVTINAGATWTKSVAVTLTLSATDATSIAQMCITNTTTCTAWKTFASTTTWSLSGGAGLRTVSVWFKDPWGNVSASPATDTIMLDSTAPSGGALVAVAGTKQVTLAWTGVSDATSGVAGYKLVGAAGTSAPSCATGTVVYQGTGVTVVHTGLTTGQRMTYRLCALDVAGNMSAGLTASTTPQ